MSAPPPRPHRTEIVTAPDGQRSILVSSVTQAEWDALTAERDRLRAEHARVAAEGNRLCDAVRNVTFGLSSLGPFAAERAALDDACDRWEGR